MADLSNEMVCDGLELIGGCEVLLLGAVGGGVGLKAGDGLLQPHVGAGGV